jgi:hypothetical protein
MGLGDPEWCLHRPDGFNFCYAPPVAVVVRVGDLHSTPVCAEHIEAAQAAIRGRTMGLSIGAVFGALHRIVWGISGEWMLTYPHRRANGGTIIFWRTVCVGVLIYALAVGFSEWVLPESTSEFSSAALQAALGPTLPLARRHPCRCLRRPVCPFRGAVDPPCRALQPDQGG